MSTSQLVENQREQALSRFIIAKQLPDAMGKTPNGLVLAAAGGENGRASIPLYCLVISAPADMTLNAGDVIATTGRIYEFLPWLGQKPLAMVERNEIICIYRHQNLPDFLVEYFKTQKFEDNAKESGIILPN